MDSYSQVEKAFSHSLLNQLGDNSNSTSLICLDSSVPGNLYISIILISQDYSSQYVIYVSVSSVINVFLILMWILRREWFPLKERSPTLVIQSLFGNFLFQLSYPLTYLYVKDNEDDVLDQKPLYLYFLCALYHFGSANFFLPYVWR
jgi:hypothetical protein